MPDAGCRQAFFERARAGEAQLGGHLVADDPDYVLRRYYLGPDGTRLVLRVVRARGFSDLLLPSRSRPAGTGEATARSS